MTVVKTRYCDADHRLYDGTPVDHPCVILPSEFLHREASGDAAGAARALNSAKKPLRPHRGILGLAVEVKSLAQVEAEQVRLALKTYSWNMCRTADALGVDRRTLYRMVQRYAIDRPKDAPPEEEEDEEEFPVGDPTMCGDFEGADPTMSGGSRSHVRVIPVQAGPRPPFRDAFVPDESMPLKRRWECPACGGDCFGTSLGRYHCQGDSLGTSSEQTEACGFWQNVDSPLWNGKGP